MLAAVKLQWWHVMIICYAVGVGLLIFVIIAVH
jgi:hypothetical protein